MDYNKDLEKNIEQYLNKPYPKDINKELRFHIENLYNIFCMSLPLDRDKFIKDVLDSINYNKIPNKSKR